MRVVAAKSDVSDMLDIAVVECAKVDWERSRTGSLQWHLSECCCDGR
jgi:hypothetical protein